ncbi:hypothetical protein AAMO2058_001187500 [Amorphochlora amoebiformis]
MAAFPVISVGLCLLIASTHGVRSPVAGGIQVAGSWSKTMVERFWQGPGSAGLDPPPEHLPLRPPPRTRPNVTSLTWEAPRNSTMLELAQSARLRVPPSRSTPKT